jgi:hypothetical protein
MHGTKVKELNKYLKVTAIINNMFGPQNFKENKNETIPYTSLSSLFYGCENWTVKARDARRATAAEIKYLRTTAGYT